MLYDNFVNENTKDLIWKFLTQEIEFRLFDERSITLSWKKVKICDNVTEEEAGGSHPGLIVCAVSNKVAA